MKRIYTRTYQTPWGAQFVKPISKNGRALTVEYFRENGERITIVNTAARVITSETYEMMTEKVGAEKMPKAPAEPKGKETKDVRRKDQDKKKDLPRGRELTKAEKETKGAKPGDYDTVDRPDADKPKIDVKKQAKEPVGSAPKAGVLEDKTYHGKDVFFAFKRAGILLGEGVLSESDMNTYRWKAILKALDQANVGKETKQAILVYLDGHEVQAESFNESHGEGGYLIRNGAVGFSYLKKDVNPRPGTEGSAVNWTTNPSLAHVFASIEDAAAITKLWDQSYAVVTADNPDKKVGRVFKGKVLEYESFNEAADDSEESAVDSDLDAALDAEAEEGEDKNEVYTGQSKDDLFANLESVSKREAEKIRNLPKDTVINIVRIVGSEVDKVIPTKVIKVVQDKNNPRVMKAEVQVQGESIRIPIMKLPGIMYLKTGAETGSYFYVDQSKADVGYEPEVNYVGGR